MFSAASFPDGGLVTVTPLLQEGTRRLRDSEPATLRTLLQEFESSGIIEYNLNGHSCDRPEGWVVGTN